MTMFFQKLPLIRPNTVFPRTKSILKSRTRGNPIVAHRRTASDCLWAQASVPGAVAAALSIFKFSTGEDDCGWLQS